MSEQIAVVGLGYVGLPVAVAFGKRLPKVIGFDVNAEKISALRHGIDHTGEVPPAELSAARICYTSDPEDLRAATFIIVAVPTPIDSNKRPDLTPLLGASRLIGRVIKPGTVVVFESTVYPGATEEDCGPIIALESGLRQGVDFQLGYSPERINPGDREHTLQQVVKVVSGQDAETLERVARTYELVVEAGVHRAPSIKVAEAAKVIENTQRDLNIALMNELALIFDRMGIRTADVLAAAGTKWNFLRFRPGLVGGHCIGVDPYYLTHKAESLGYHPQVILAGRGVNDGMGKFLAQRMVKLLFHAGNGANRKARIGILGLTFKENVPDIRNSRVPDIVAELKEFGISPLVHDPLACPEEAESEYGIRTSPLEEFTALDGLILAVNHRAYEEMGAASLCAMLKPGGVLVDVKSALCGAAIPDDVVYWSL